MAKWLKLSEEEADVFDAVAKAYAEGQVDEDGDSVDEEPLNLKDVLKTAGTTSKRFAIKRLRSAKQSKTLDKQIPASTEHSSTGSIPMGR